MKSMHFIFAISQAFFLTVSAQEYNIYPLTVQAVPVGTIQAITYDDVRNVVYLTGISTTFFDGLVKPGVSNCFVTKHFLNGTRQWSRIVGSPVWENCKKLILEPLTGDLIGFGDSQGNFEGMTSAGSWDACLFRFTTNGTKVFTFLFGTANDDWTYEALLDRQSTRVIIATRYNNNIAITTNSALNGSVLSIAQFPATGFAHGVAKAIGESDILTTGCTNAGFDGFGYLGACDLFLTHMNTNGTRYWSRVWAASNQDDKGRIVVFDQQNSRVFVTGEVQSGGLNGQTALGGWDAILISTHINGTLLFTKQFGTNADDSGLALMQHKASGNLFVLGYMVGTYPGKSVSGICGYLALFSPNGTMLNIKFHSVSSSWIQFAFGNSDSVAVFADSGTTYAWGNISYVPPPTPSPVLVSSVASSTLRTSTLASSTIISSTPLSTSTFVPPDPVAVVTTTESAAASDAPSPDVIAAAQSSLTSSLGSVLPLIFAAAGLLLMIIVVIGLWTLLVIRRRKSSKLLTAERSVTERSLEGSYDSSTTASSASFIPSSISTYSAGVTAMVGMTTLMPTSFELSLPGFLRFENGATFRLTKEIAKGGGGSVWIGDALISALRIYGSTIVVKTVGKGGQKNLGMHSENTQKAFKQEVSLMYYFREEKYIAKILGWCDSPAALLMKHYPLGSLDKWIHDRKNFKSKMLLISFIQDISKGIQAMHTAGFIHCDLKPQNVLIDQDENEEMFCCLTDFGIAQVVDANTLQVKDFEVIALRGMSVRYASPEMFASFRSKLAAQSYDGQVKLKSDIYSFAIISLELLSRQRPWS